MSDFDWLDMHDAIVHWHNGRVHIDWRTGTGMRVQRSAECFKEVIDTARAHEQRLQTKRDRDETS